MAVKLGDMVFHDWMSIPVPGGYTDTFQLVVSPDAGQPPRAYGQVLRRIVGPVFPLRKSMSLWVKVEGASGVWYRRELRDALEGLPCPVAVLNGERIPDDRDFSFRPWTDTRPSPRPPAAEPLFDPSLIDEVQRRCLQVLARLNAGYTAEVASLAGLDVVEVRRAMGELAEQKFVMYQETGGPESESGDSGDADGNKVRHKDSTGRHPEKTYLHGRYPFWVVRRPGVSLALRSWGIPPGVSFRERREDAYVNNWHRRTARLWPGRLRQAWPHLEIWGVWTEVPLGLIRPDILIWGRLWGKETLVVVEVERGNRTKDLLAPRIWDRFDRAVDYARGFGLPVVVVLLSPPWVRKVVLRNTGQVPQDAALVLTDWRRADTQNIPGEPERAVPAPEWGRVRFLRS